MTRPIWPLRPLTPVLASFLLIGCGSAGEYNAEPSAPQKVTSAQIKEEAPHADAPGADNAVGAPRIAYTYTYDYRLPADRIAKVQQQQVALCEKQGPKTCRVLDMRQTSGEHGLAGGSLTLAVAAPRARAFGGELGQLVAGAEGEAVASSITGEDLSKQIVDTTARLKARTVLRDRLMEILATRQGKVSELVEAERSVAKVNEEIDQARSWLAEMQGRVDYSRLELGYTSSSTARAQGNSFLAPIAAVTANLGTILGTIVALILALAAVGIPLGLVIWLIVWGVKRLRRDNVEG